MTLKMLRENYKITMKVAASITNIPLRTYARYEADESYGDKYKRQAMIQLIKDRYEISENSGILDIDTIKANVTSVLVNYKDSVQFCYLFGSYAKGYANVSSDVDLLVSTSLKGLSFVGLSEDLHQSLKKKVDLIRLSDLNNNIEFVTEIMKDGIKIYG